MDNRVSLFCKISPEAKEALGALTDHYGVNQGEYLEGKLLQALQDLEQAKIKRAREKLELFKP